MGRKRTRPTCTPPDVIHYQGRARGISIMQVTHLGLVTPVIKGKIWVQGKQLLNDRTPTHLRRSPALRSSGSTSGTWQLVLSLARNLLFQHVISFLLSLSRSFSLSLRFVFIHAFSSRTLKTLRFLFFNDMLCSLVCAQKRIIVSVTHDCCSVTERTWTLFTLAEGC